MIDSVDSFSADRPLLDPAEDTLGYGPFSEQLAKSIQKMSPNDGLVFAINGPWGSGKSTILNFVVFYLEQLPAEERPIIFRYNPSWFSSHESLTKLFINQLSVRLGKKDFKALKSFLADFSDLISVVPAPGTKIGEIFSKRLRDQPDLTSLKEKIEKILLEKGKKILVLVDDIDRLSPYETQDLFRTIKAIANFPNVIYLLAFDSTVVASALEQGYVISGKDYLEKIVQVPFDLPAPDKVPLRRLLFSKLDTILVNTSEGLFDKSYWMNVYYSGMDPFIKTPRDIVRLINVLRATYPSVENEVNPVDFIAIEAVRVFLPQIYKTIRENEEILTGQPGSPIAQEDEKRRAIFEEWLKLAPVAERETIKRLLGHLFPRFGTVFGGSYYSASHNELRRLLRICSRDIFPIYFRFSVPSDAITNTEMKKLLSCTSDEPSFSEMLITYSRQHRQDGTTKLRAILERFEDFTQEKIPEENISLIVHVLLDIGDQLLLKEDEGRGLFEMGNEIRIGRIVYQLLSRLDQSARSEILHSAISKSRSLSTPVRQVSVLSQEHGKPGGQVEQPEDRRVVTIEQLEILEKIVLEKIRVSAKEGSLLHRPHLIYILHRWQAWSRNQEASEWVSEIIRDESCLAELLAQFGHEQRAQTIGDIAIQRQYRLDPKWIEPFIDPAEVAKLALPLIENETLTEKQRMAVAQFLMEYTLREQGKNPDDEF